MDAIEGIANGASNYEKYKDLFETKDKDLITMDNFYSLLVAEMQNQDPLEPTSNTEFISQMASFTALQAQQDAFDIQQQQYANSLIGKTVTVASQDKTITGIVTSVTSGDDPQVMIDGNNYKLSAITQVHSGDTGTQSVVGDYGAFAASILGKQVTVGFIGSDGESYYDEGEVQSLEIEDGNVRVIVNGYAYDVSDVVKVTDVTTQAVSNGFDEDYDTVTAAENNTAAQTAAQSTLVTNFAEDDLSAEPDIEDIAESEEVSDQMLRELFE